jgi:hypothetical protein
MGYISDAKSFREFTQYIEKKNMITKDIITDLVIGDLTSRAERGYKKYNTTLGENNHQNMLQHAYEEALDLAQYLKKEIVTMNTIQDLLKNHSNDSELGYAIRRVYGKK